MSLHASKGLTAKLVVLAGLVEGVIPFVDEEAPDDEQEAMLQEQRRLFFVGITRPTDVLVLSSYSSLPDDVVYRLRAATGQRLGRTFRTFSSSFIAELGPELPDAMRGEDWTF